MGQDLSTAGHHATKNQRQLRRVHWEAFTPEHIMPTDVSSVRRIVFKYELLLYVCFLHP